MRDRRAYVYVLRSVRDGWCYVGSSVDPGRRLLEHNAGESASTRARRPYEMAYIEPFPNLPAARKRELEIKRKKSRRYIDWLIASQGGGFGELARPESFREGRGFKSRRPDHLQADGQNHLGTDQRQTGRRVCFQVGTRPSPWSNRASNAGARRVCRET
jgi:putative endonuclease